MRPVLIDTSAWVDFLRPGLRPLGERVDELLDADQARICGVVVAELLHGLKGTGEQRQILVVSACFRKFFNRYRLKQKTAVFIEEFCRLSTGLQVAQVLTKRG